MTFDRKAYQRKYGRIWRQKPEVKAREALRRKSKHRIAYMKEYWKTYGKTPEVRMKNKVRCKVNSMIRSGALIRQICSIENCNTIGEAHHEDYNKPLDIVWLCRYHHTLLHKKV